VDVIVILIFISYSTTTATTSRNVHLRIHQDDHHDSDCHGDKPVILIYF